MKTRYKLIAFAFGITLFCVACSEETKNKIEQVKQGVSSTTSFVKDANSVQTEIERLQKLTPISNEQLKTWLPESVAGLKRAGFKVGQAGYMKINSVEGTYKDESSKKRLKVQVIDGAGPTGSVLIPSYGLLGNIDSEMEDEYKHEKTVTVGGIKARQTFNKKRTSTTLTFLYNKRFMVQVDGTDMTPEETWGMVKKIQLKKLATTAT
ncbi:hypothetical protein ABN763_18135 [Spongiivirga sp. MCCC 1A20706]|uniref:hypothetical protein n=1 Tax=Spongiivirga sp. MCCC 1A20706 TaxID=3160963 RepID=UPI003977D60B